MDIVTGNIDQKTLIFNVEVLMRLDVGIEIRMVDIDRASAQKPRFGELVSR